MGSAPGQGLLCAGCGAGAFQGPAALSSTRLCMTWAFTEAGVPSSTVQGTSCASPALAMSSTCTAGAAMTPSAEDRKTLLRDLIDKAAAGKLSVSRNSVLPLDDQELELLVQHDLTTSDVLQHSTYDELVNAGVSRGAAKVLKLLFPGATAGHIQRPVVQQGSLTEGEVFVTVILQHDGKQLKAELLLDTGCHMDLTISGYKADQLGLPPPSKRAAQLELWNKHMGALWRRGAVEVTVLLEGEGEEVLEDPLRSRLLDVWTDVGSNAGSHPDGATSASSPGPSSSTADAGSASLIIKVLSPIRQGKDGHDCDAILGATGMARLRLGIDRETGRLYVKHINLHRLGGRVSS